jgi:hypothetical protein
LTDSITSKAKRLWSGLTAWIRGTFTVSGGAVGVDRHVMDCGAGYEARYQSTKLAYGVGEGSALTAKKRISQLGVICRNLHAQGLTYGPDFDTLDNMPMIERGVAVDQDSVATCTTKRCSPSLDIGTATPGFA